MVYIIPNFLVLFFWWKFHANSNIIAKLQKNEKLNENIFIEIFMHFNEGQLKQQIHCLFLISYDFNTFKIATKFF